MDRWIILTAACLASAVLFGGCAGTATTYSGELTDQAIVGRLPAPAAAGEQGEGEPATAPRIVSAEEARQGVEGVAVLTGPPNRTLSGGADGAAASGQSGLGASDSARDDNAVLVDAMVGQINGRPVYASEFFAPMDSRLRAEAKQLPPQKWLQSVRDQVRRALEDRVRDELLLAEFEANAPPEQKQGLIAFVRQLREGVISENRGSEMLAQERLSREGLTIEDKVREQRDEELIRHMLRQNVLSRVYVSWRDVLQEWERNQDRYNPPGKATLRMIWVKKSDAERIARVTAALESGEPFASVARRESEFQPDEGGLHEAAVTRPSYAQSQIFAPAILNEKAVSLSPGQTTGPFDYEGRVVWMTLESIDRAERTLFDTQILVESELQKRQYEEEYRKYLVRLMERGTLTDLKQMEDRLFEIAAHRYLIAGRN